MTWKVKEAWPVKIEGPGLKATGTDVAIESVEFACEGIEIEAK
jgi:phage tail-like protein